MSLLEDNIQDNKLQIIGKLTASLIHEIRNPLSAIKLNLDYLKMIEDEIPKEANESIQVCSDALSRIQNLIDNMFTLVKKNHLNSTAYSINEITRNAYAIMHETAESKNVKFNIKLNESIPNYCLDKNKLLQVFLNLITNAIESCEPGGEISVNTYMDKGDIIWEVKDTGVGIKEEEKDKIFQDFYTSKEKGTGLGLSVCKMLLQEFQADLDFESEPGRGSRFFITFNPNYLGSNDKIQNINN